jgi:hypothetical protein
VPRRIRWRQRGFEREEEEPSLRTARDQSGPAAEQRLQKRKRSKRSAASLAGEEAFCHQPSRFPRPPPTWHRGLWIPRRRLRNNAKPANSPPQSHRRKTHEQISTSRRHPNNHTGDHKPTEFTHEFPQKSSPASDLGGILRRRRLHRWADGGVYGEDGGALELGFQ